MATSRSGFSLTPIQLTALLAGGVGLGFLLGIVFAKRRRLSQQIVNKSGSASEMLDVSSDDVSGELKMVLMVRTDLKMAKGKIAAQVGHAAVGGYKQAKRNNSELLHCWERAGQMKVIVKAPEREAFVQTIRDASVLGVNTYLVRDAGRTQVAPGSETVLCVGPGPAEIIDQLTGHFKLY